MQAGRGIPYRTVMAESLAQSRGRARTRRPVRERGRARDVDAHLAAFPDVRASLTELRSRGWKLGILSNTDPDFLDASLTAIGVPVDLRVVASDIGSYKPAFGHWESFFRQTRADRARHVHVAASLFHDVQPCAALGLPCVWINRQDEVSDLPRAGELTTSRTSPTSSTDSSRPATGSIEPRWTRTGSTTRRSSRASA